ncbi:MAG: 50S ribosomal protein L25 [Desulfobulbaceae bacterium]|nr:50S ribosomal protein L25 [Desulfobulbaceae bacterium]
MIQQDMSAILRKDFGKGPTHQLRLSGYAPAILYGCKMEPIALAMDEKTLTRNLLKLHGHNVILSLDIEGDESKKKHHVLIKDIQTHPVSDAVLHVDFLEIELEKEIVMEVPIVYTGTAIGVDLGGILNIMAHTVKIKGLPLEILDEITVDVTPLEVGGAGITCGDLPIPANVTLEEDLERVCVAVIAPKAEVEEEVEEEEGEAAESAEADADAAPEGDESAASTEE